MATTKVSALAAKTSLAGSEELLINDGGTSKKVTATNLLAGAAVADGSISTAKIADDAVTADKLANSINTDIATGVTANTTANAALPKAGGAMTGAITTNSTFDGRDVATDGTKLDTVETNADVTDVTNVTAAGAAMLTGATFTGAVTAPDFIGPLNGAIRFTAKNDEGVAITQGQVVYIKGVSGDVPTVGLADANDSAKMPAFGLAYTAANNNASVEIVTFGSLGDTKTDYTGWTLGDTLYVSTTAGALTNSAPTGESSLIQNVGKIQRVHATAGIIKVGGAGRSNATPNLNDGNVFIGNASNQAAARALVVADTTGLQTALDAALPKTGGTMTGNLDLGDNNKLLIGTGNDLEIYHDGSNSYIVDNGTGNLRLQGQAELLLLDGENHHYIRCVNDGAVSLFYDNNEKIATTANGVTITGTAVATTDTDATNTGSVTLDFAANQNFVLTLTGNVTLANPSTEQVGQSGFITFIQDGTGGRTVALGTDYETAGGAGLTLSSTASATDIVPYVVVASGRILLGTPQLAFA
jgi:hypothetical protein